MKHELSSMGLRSLRLEHVKPESVSIGKSTEAIELTDFHFNHFPSPCRSGIANERIQEWIDGKTIRKVIAVPDKLVNIVVA